VYFPYFRGKQFELVALRENAALIAGAGFSPIIEPVKESLAGLVRALDALSQVNGEAIVITNPEHGDHAEDSSAIESLVAELEEAHSKLTVGFLLRNDWNAAEFITTARRYRDRRIALIHAGAPDAKGVLQALSEIPLDIANCCHIFLEDYCSTLYRRHFKSERRVLIRDGFQKRPNRAHPDVETFSDLHVTFSEQGMTGFGDFLVVGDDYSETGGPAYAVAIHLTFIDPERDDEMFIHHFKSTRSDTPKDPAGKFLEALARLRSEVLSPNSKVERTAAVEEFLALYESKHFPGLGYLKKLSMAHHIETLARYCARAY